MVRKGIIIFTCDEHYNAHSSIYVLYVFLGLFWIHRMLFMDYLYSYSWFSENPKFESKLTATLGIE